MPDHIGIVACSAEGASLCYRIICAEGEQVLGTYGHPEVSIHGHSLASYVRSIEADDWEAVGELMLSSATKLAKAGASFLICPDNTIHQALPLIQSKLTLPWLHIAEVVALQQEVRRLGGFMRSPWLYSGKNCRTKL
jgi:aspartate racemase